MNIFLVRHGKTEYNRDFKMQGWVDSPLLEETVRLTKNVAQGLNNEGIEFDKAYASDLLRAQNTARIILEEMNQDVNVQVNYGIKEIDFGQAGGQNVNEVWNTVAKKHGYKDRNDLNKHVESMKRIELLKKVEAFNKTEDAQTFYERVIKGFNEIIEASDEDDNILIVSHTISIIAILKDLGLSNVSEHDVSNLSVTSITVENGNASINYTNKDFTK